MNSYTVQLVLFRTYGSYLDSGRLSSVKKYIFSRSFTVIVAYVFKLLLKLHI